MLPAEPLDEAPLTAGEAPIGQRSTLFLIVSYRHPDSEQGAFDLEAFERRLLAEGNFRPKRIDDPTLLPHLNVQVQAGRLLRAYEPTATLGNLFDPRARWVFERPPKPQRAAAPASADEADGDESRAPVQKKPSERGRDPGMPFKVVVPPRLYVIETGHVFVVLGVRPTTLTLGAFQDFYTAVVRRGYNHLLPERMPRRKAGRDGETRPHPLVAMAEKAAIKGTTLRDWLTLLVPGLPVEAPIGSWPNPMAVNVLFTEAMPGPADRYRLRLSHGSDQPIEPSQEDCRIEGHKAMWEPSARELCLFSPIGVTWLLWPLDPPGQLGQFDMAVLERYVYKWILVEHERLFLLNLSSQCARLSTRPDARVFGRMRLSLLQYTARFSVGHISSEERHDRFYCGLRAALDIGGLFDEVKAEITEIDEYLSDRRAELLNQVLAFLTLVLTPVGLVIGIFERGTLPAFDFELARLAMPGAWPLWRACLFHGPLWLLVLSAVAGTLGFVRLLGIGTLRSLVARVLRGRGADD
ncbi:putative membrane protein [Sorangium cellulosum So ce56]|uniref:Membrane protein n=1 Tax=Sorangium cellulosum (strain So ce56) TaxID=448385 RepID=A9GK83_SORC5|nr:hypothetical protein [Sorangium cellulosum]CAN96547.1 putative membrane protein [Sorangium cellulosum So ce56]